MTLLSVLRNGDHRFLPLLLAKVNDVLPRLVNPMLQTVPDTPANMCAEVDIFDGFGNAGIGVASNFPGYNGNGTSGGEFKMEPDTDFNGNSISGMPQYDKRIEDLSSPINEGSSDSTSFTSPSVMQSPMEYSGLQEYGGFPDLNQHGIPNNVGVHNHTGNFGEGVGGGGRPMGSMGPVGQMAQMEFKREFEGTMGLLSANRPGMGMDGVRRPPLRQGSGSSYGIQIPRSVPDQYRHLQRANSGGSVEMGMNGGGDMTFR